MDVSALTARAAGGDAEAMSQHPDQVIVVGAGIVGLSTAWFLQQRGVEVTVVERDAVAAGSSWGNAGWLAPALTMPLPDPAILSTGVRAALSPSSPVYVPFAVDPRLWRFLAGFLRHCTPRRWRSAMSVFNEANAQALAAYDDVPGAPTKSAEPFLAAFDSAQDRQVLLDEFAHAGGTVDYELLDADAVHRLEPLLSREVTHGVRIHHQRFINPGEYVGALADAVIAAGGSIRTGADVQRIVDTGNGAEVRLASGESLRADRIVIANGAWMSDLARPFGVKAVVQAGRGYSFTVRPWRVPSGPVYFPAQRVACTPLGDAAAGLRVAGMMEFRSPDAPLDPRRIDAIVAAAGRMFEGVDWSSRTSEWVGSRPCTADGLPLVGATSSPRVFVAGGHGMWGVALGPLTGRLLAEQITTGVVPGLLRAFDPLR